VPRRLIPRHVGAVHATATHCQFFSLRRQLRNFFEARFIDCPIVDDGELADGACQALINL
jgi:hypothetical protein